MIKKILKGFHLAKNDFTYPMVHSGLMNKKVTFTDSCRYILDNEDQKDWNKLFGFSFGFFPLFKQYMQHQNSFRIGWRYNPESDKIEITPYYYIDGKRHFNTDPKDIISLNLNECYIITICVDVAGGYIKARHSNKTFITDVFFVPFYNTNVYKPYGFKAPLYFGGTDKTPQDIEIIIENV